MKTEQDAFTWIRHNHTLLLNALRRDSWKIALVVLLTAMVGGAAGKLTNTARSTAQLLLTPAPIRDNFDPEKGLWQYSADDSALVRMMARPLEANTAVLICMSDSVMQTTYHLLTNADDLSAPPDSINSVKNALSCEVNLDIETPYEVRYSPVIQLQASAKVPADARIMVNTWAEVCVGKASEFQQARQQPQAEAFQEKATEIREAYDAIRDRGTSPPQTTTADPAGTPERPIIDRESRTMDSILTDMTAKAEYAEMAAEFGRSPLHLLNPGTEWPLPRYRRALLFGGIAGVWGLILGVALSLGGRILFTTPKDMG